MCWEVAQAVPEAAAEGQAQHHQWNGLGRVWQITIADTVLAASTTLSQQICQDAKLT